MDTIDVPSKSEFDAMTAEQKAFAWELLQRQLTDIKKIESQMRSELLKLYFQDKAPGTRNRKIGDTEWVLKCSINETQELTKDLDAVRAVEANLPVYLRGQLFNWKPSVSTTVYKTLDPVNKQMVDTVLTPKLGTPKLEMVIPKR